MAAFARPYNLADKTIWCMELQGQSRLKVRLQGDSEIRR
jgi:hypothetical protein